MKQRIISAMIGLGILLVVLLFFETIIFNFAIAVIACLAVFEILLATKCTKNKGLTALCLLFAAVIPFLQMLLEHHGIVPLICYLFVAIALLILIGQHDHLHFEQVGFSIFVTLAISFSLATGGNIRDKYGFTVGLFYLLLALASAWIGDTGAYFSGRVFGKRKLAPQISPNKTVEGAFGGVLAVVAFYLLAGFGYSQLLTGLGIAHSINYGFLLLIAPICAAAGIVGDLSASIIKRQCYIKDFGSIMPGHGGIMDRFDSAFMTLPLFYCFVTYLPIVILK